jgi:mercuric ion transport protein
MDSRKVSILSALAASSCCVPPLILLGLTLVGVGTAGMAGFSSTLGALKWYIFPLAILGLGFSYYLYYKEKKKCMTESCKMVNKKFTESMLVVSTVVVVGFLGWSVYPYVIPSDSMPLNSSVMKEAASSAHYAVYKVDGMTCGGCEVALDGAIAATGLVDSVKSDFTQGKAYLWYNKGELDTVKIDEAINSVGYKSELLENN